MSEPSKPNQAIVPAAKTTTLALRVSAQQIAELDAVAAECGQIAKTATSAFHRTFMMAAGMQKLRSLITDEMMPDVMALQGSSLGFRTDKDTDGGYPLATVKEVAIEATLRGLRLVGNEVNIIAGRCYAAKDGLKRLVREWPGLADLKIQLLRPRTVEGQMMVPAKAAWKLDGVPHALDLTGDAAIPIRVNQSSIIDAILGKAERKLYARIYDVLTGTQQGLVEPDDAAPLAEEPPAAPEPAFTPTPTPPPAQDAGQVDAQTQMAALVEEYVAAIQQTSVQRDVTPIVKAAGTDERLDKRARQKVADAANKHSEALKGRGPQQREFLDRGRSATEAGY